MKYTHKLSILDFNQAYSVIKKIARKSVLQDISIIIGLSLALIIAGLIFVFAVAQPQYGEAASSALYSAHNEF